MAPKSIYEEFVEKINQYKKQEEDTSQLLKEIKKLFDIYITQEIELKRYKNSLYEEILRKIKELEEQENLFRAVIEHIEMLYSQLAKSQTELEEKHKQLVEEIEKRKKIEQELIKAKEEAEIASKAKSDFLARMSHEIRTPLTGIVGFVDLLSQTELNELQKRYIEIIKNSIQSLINIVNDILDMAKIEEGKYELGYTNVNSYIELDRMIKVFAPEAKQKKLNYIYTLDPKLSECLTFPVQAIRQILYNLISNAIKFTEKGKIEVKIEVIEDKENTQVLKFEVKDTGIGIPKEKLKEIFDKFSQIYRDKETKYSGTGLGLSIASSLVKMLGGKLKVKSKVGEGSVFYFTAEFNKCVPEVSISELFRLKNVFVEETDDDRSKKLVQLLNFWKIPYYHLKLDQVEGSEKRFDIVIFFNTHNLKKFFDICKHCKKFILISEEPVKIEDEKVIVSPFHPSELYETLLKTIGIEEKSEKERIQKKFKAKILVAEDNEINRTLIEELLKKYGVEFDIVENGLIAIDKIKKNKYDFVLMDISMPVMDGETATKVIKKEYPNIPVIALTAHSFPGEKERLLNFGFDDYIFKPILSIDLEKVLEKYAKVILVEPEYKEKTIDESDISKEKISFIEKAKFELRLSEDVLKKLMDKFFETLPLRIEELERFLKEKNYKELAKSAHNLKGSSGSLRLETLYSLSKEIEEKAKMGEIENYLELFTKFKEEAKKIEKIYKLWKKGKN